jgi:hypothetical protein
MLPEYGGGSLVNLMASLVAAPSGASPIATCRRGAPHPSFAERIGDVALLMNERFTIKDWTPGESRHLHIGNHGGASEEEMTVPLIVAVI